MTLREALHLAVQHQQAGRHDQAEQLYRRILQAAPDELNALNLLGVIVNARGEHGEAIDLISRAIRINGAIAEIHNNLGAAYMAANRLTEAVRSFGRGVALKDNDALMHKNLAEGLRRLGDLEKSLAHARRAVELAPVAEHLDLLGDVLYDRRELSESIEAFRCALAIDPGSAHTHNSIGSALKLRGDLAEAELHFRQALKLRPDFHAAWTNLGSLLSAGPGLQEAIVVYRRALQLSAESIIALNGLGVALRRIGLPDEAAECLERAIAIDSRSIEAMNNLALVRLDQGRVEDAVAGCEQALRLRPDSAEVHGTLLIARIFLPGDDGSALYEEQLRWGQRHADYLSGAVAPHVNDRSPDRRLRIGYVAPNFREHCQTLFTIPLLSSHDRRIVEVFCYSDVTLPDTFTDRIKSHADVWRDVRQLDDEQLAALIREDAIDVLVDLTMHLAENRELMFARKPAPVQVCWLAYPGSTGMRAMDYRISDPRLDPPGPNDRLYLERTIRLPDSFWCYDPLEDRAVVGPLPVDLTGHITFGCLNNFCKVNQTVLRLWARLLHAVPGSRMIILSSKGRHRQYALDLMSREGIQPDRIEFVAYQPRQQYLQTYGRIDIALDTFPANGHTTTLDGLWMGVPIVTIVGQTVSGRAGLSQMTVLGLPELIARYEEEYIEIASNLAADRPRLRELRGSLRQRLRDSPLMDSPRFARHLEAAYRQMWTNWCAGSDTFMLRDRGQFHEAPGDDLQVPFLVEDENAAAPKRGIGAPTPKVSCLMVTSGRGALMRRSIACFRAQTYRASELVIVVARQENELAAHLDSLDDPRIRLIIHDRSDATLGGLRNLAIARAESELICIWDDDDLYDPSRISVQVSVLIRSGALACVMERLVLWWPAQQRLAVTERRAWEGSLMAVRAAMPNYADLPRGEDTPLIEKLRRSVRFATFDLPRLYVYVAHATNVSPRAQFEHWWQTASERFLGRDYDDFLRVLGMRLPLELASSADPPSLADLETCEAEVRGPHLPPAPATQAASPMISCLMVTRCREPLARIAIGCFLRQTHPDKELVIVTERLTPALRSYLDNLATDSIRVVEVGDLGHELGALRNIAMDHAAGELVCQWDDDDLYDAERLSQQLSAMRDAQAHACLLQRWMIWWPGQQRLAVSARRDWEGSLLAHKSVIPPYPALRIGEDTPVVEHLLRRFRVVSVDIPRLYVYRVHEDNTFARSHFQRHWDAATAQYTGARYQAVLADLASRFAPLEIPRFGADGVG